MSSTTVASIELFGVTKVFRDGSRVATAVDDVRLSIEPGTLSLIMGPSGSGKSTLLKLIAGLIRPDVGRVMVEGCDVGGLDAAGIAVLLRQTVGFVFQELNLIDDLTALANVTLPLEFDGIPRREARGAALAALSDLGVADLARAYPGALSGGEQQRVAIARALVGTRNILLADEPTAALDSENASRLMTLLREACSRGKTVLMASHDLNLVEHADHVMEMADGRIL